mgnify:CR=1 FL=1
MLRRPTTSCPHCSTPQAPGRQWTHDRKCQAAFGMYQHRTLYRLGEVLDQVSQARRSRRRTCS